MCLGGSFECLLVSQRFEGELARYAMRMPDVFDIDLTCAELDDRSSKRGLEFSVA